MTYDIGSSGLLILLGSSLGFGAIARLFTGRSASHWVWISGVVGWIVGGVFASEVLVGKMTAEEIQPIIDGLAFDEALLGGLIGGVIAFLSARRLARAGGAAGTNRAPA